VQAYNLADNSKAESGPGRALLCLAKSLKNKVSFCGRDPSAFVPDLHYNGIVVTNSCSHRHSDASGAMNERILNQVAQHIPQVI
jgi:hypothetical protein